MSWRVFREEVEEAKRAGELGAFIEEMKGSSEGVSRADIWVEDISEFPGKARDMLHAQMVAGEKESLPVYPMYVSDTEYQEMSEEPELYLWFEMDPHVVPVVRALDRAGFDTYLSSCQGGYGHDYSEGHIVLKGESIHTPEDIRGIRTVVAALTDTKFRIVKVRMQTDEPPADPGDYVIEFKGPMRLRGLS